MRRRGLTCRWLTPRPISGPNTTESEETMERKAIHSIHMPIGNNAEVV